MRTLPVALLALALAAGCGSPAPNSTAPTATPTVSPWTPPPALSYTPPPAIPASPPAAPVPAKPAGPATTVTDGTYLVGADIAPGRYRTRGPLTHDVLDQCYWARRKDDSGGFNSIIANGLTKGPASVTVNRGEFLEVSNGCTWTKQ